MKYELIKELSFTAVRSGGAGGQHVNKVSSKIVLKFDINASNILSVNEKERLVQVLNHRLNKEGRLIMTCEETRSQFKNKERVIKKFLILIAKGLLVKKKRKPIKRSKSDNLKRLEKKSRLSKKKADRKKIVL